jgi:hypothetical protein
MQRDPCRRQERPTCAITSNVRWLYDDDSRPEHRQRREVAGVKGQQVANAVDMANGNQADIMDLLANHLII